MRPWPRAAAQTEKMRKAGGLSLIVDAIKRLGAKHAQHIAAYGEGGAAG